MKTDNVVRVEAINILLTNLGEVDTERFISMIKRDTFALIFSAFLRSITAKPHLFVIVSHCGS